MMGGSWYGQVSALAEVYDQLTDGEHIVDNICVKGFWIMRVGYPVEYGYSYLDHLTGYGDLLAFIYRKDNPVAWMMWVKNLDSYELLKLWDQSQYDNKGSYEVLKDQWLEYLLLEGLVRIPEFKHWREYDYLKED